MSDERDYLWTGDGSVDPDIERLETALGAARHRSDIPAPRLRRPRAGVLVVAACALAVALGWQFWPAPDSMPVTTLSGSPRIDGTAVDRGARLREGQKLTTDSASRARLVVGDIGAVRIEPGTDVALVSTGRDGHRLAMTRGEISALITAPPRLFFVETPGAVAVDLGCAYTLSIGDDGVGLLEVTAGKVALEWQGRSVEAPAGVRCAIRPGAGPGVPWARNAPELLVKELERLETGQSDDATLPALLAAARPRDSITLWHLLESALLGDAERGLVFDRLAILVPVPGGVTREAIVAQEAEALRRYRRALAPQW